MTRIVALLLAVVLVAAGSALAARGDPQKRITPADQARAKAMLLRAADLSVAYVARPSSSGSGDFYCAALDESDLTVSGDAKSPSFTTTGEQIASTAYVYRSRADADASWRRGTSDAGVECLRAGLRAQFRGTGVRLASFKRMAFPARGQRSVAFRAVATQQGIRVFIDLVAMQVSRAQVGVTYGTALSPPPRSELRRLSALVAARAQKAMRGSS